MSNYELHHGDCLEVMRDIPDGSIDCVITDIPYGEVNRGSNGLRVLDKNNADVETFSLSEFIHAITTKCHGSFYVFCGTEQVSEIRRLFVKDGLSTRLCIWEKTNPSPMNGQNIWLSGIECCVYAKKPKATFNEFCKNTVWRFPNGSSKVHPTQKPTKLMQYLVKASTNEGDVIFDPCAGSGTTGVAALLENRKFIGIEKDAGYFEIAKNRIAEVETREPLFV